MQRIAGIILAAGASTRMGDDKALLRWGEKTFLEHLMAALKKSGAGVVRVVLGANAEAVQARLRFNPGEAVVNPQWEMGQLSSLIAGLDSLPAGMVEGAVVCLVDQPAVSSRVIQTLLEKFNETRKLIVTPTYKSKRGHPVLFSAALFAELRAAPLEVGARHLLRQHAGDVLEVETEDEGVVLNINDRSAYEKILRSPPPE